MRKFLALIEAKMQDITQIIFIYIVLILVKYMTKHVISQKALFWYTVYLSKPSYKYVICKMQKK